MRSRPHPGAAPTDPTGTADRAGSHDHVEDPLLATMVAERPLLVGLAYRITGSRVEAEDIVQEAWLRARRTDGATIDNPEAWLTRVVARLALDHLRSARHRRESYVGPWLPEPVFGSVINARMVEDPAAASELAESVTFGFLRMLETLAPLERVVFLMSDVFDVPFAEIGMAVDRSPEACRQISSRARRRIREGAARHEVPDDADSVLGELLAALTAGDVDRVLALLAEDAVLVSDGGAQTYAARRPVVGRERVARFLVNMARRLASTDLTIESAVVNGEPGVVATGGGRWVLTLTAHVDDGAIAALYSVVNPDKLAALDIADPMM
ncbi:MAG TPA: RNA polymerase sigma factor SigJ [Acidimicrobiales bacterium]